MIRIDGIGYKDSMSEVTAAISVRFFDRRRRTCAGCSRRSHTGKPSLYSGGIGNPHPQVVEDVLARWTRLPIPLVDLFISLAVLYPRRPRVPERE